MIPIYPQVNKCFQKWMKEWKFVWNNNLLNAHLEGAGEGGPGSEVDQAAGGRLQQHGLAVRNTLGNITDILSITRG